jgi:hypothetical protein
MCPICGQPGRPLPDSSADSDVEYYRCDECKQVWSNRKDDPESEAKRVTTTEKQE